MVDLSRESVALVTGAAEAANTALQAKYEAMLAIVDRLPIGVILVGRGCEVHETNERAREILSLDDGIQIHHRVLKAASHSETRHLHQVVALALNPQNGLQLPGEDVIALSRTSGLLEFSALVLPLAANQNLTLEPLATIFLSETSRPIEIDPRRLEKLHNFTRCEARITSLLVQGLNLKDAAKYLGVSHNTVKSQLQSVFSKTGCDRQSELVRTILSGVSILKSESKNEQIPRKSRL